MTIPDEAVQADTHATAARLNRLLTVCHGLRWTDVGVLSLENESTKKALGDLSEILFMDGIDEVVSGKSTTSALPFLQGVKVSRDNYSEFALEICRIAFDGGDVSGDQIQEIGIAHGVLRLEKYDEESHKTIAHSDLFSPGDDVYIFVEPSEPAPSPRAQALEEAEHAVGSTVLMHRASDYEGLDSLEAYEAGQMNGLERAQASLRALSSQPVATTRPTGGSDDRS